MNRALNTLLYIYILLLPLAWIIPGTPRNGQLIFFMVIGIVIVSKQIENIWIKLFGVYISMWIVFASLLLLFQISSKMKETTKK